MLFGIGYKVKVVGSEDYRASYGGWSEGDPMLETKTMKSGLKQGLKYVTKKLVGSATPYKVADILSKPLQGLAEGVGTFIVIKLKEINRLLADEGLQLIDVDVTITGDFDARYRIEDSDDLDALPKLLALLPRKGDEDDPMGAAIVGTVYMAHVNFARHQRNFGSWDVSTQTSKWLEIDITV